MFRSINYTAGSSTSQSSFMHIGLNQYYKSGLVASYAMQSDVRCGTGRHIEHSIWCACEILMPFMPCIYHLGYYPNGCVGEITDTKRRLSWNLFPRFRVSRLDCHTYNCRSFLLCLKILPQPPFCFRITHQTWRGHDHATQLALCH